MSLDPGQARHCDLPQIPVLSEREIKERLGALSGWQIRQSQLTRSYEFDHPASALAFVAEIGRTAEARNHHPHVHWFKRQVTVALWTHKSNGLTARDFKFAACCDRLEERQRGQRQTV